MSPLPRRPPRFAIVLTWVHERQRPPVYRGELQPELQPRPRTGGADGGFDLIGEDVDITPARHLPSDSVARISLDLLTRHRSSLQALLAELPHLLPDLPPDRPPAGAAPRGSSLEELAQSGHALHPQNRTPGCH
jgi:hypothetical protein